MAKLSATDIDTTADVVLIENVLVSGVVLDGVSSMPLAGARVMIADYRNVHDKNAERVVTSAAGEFTLSAMPNTTIRLRAEAPGKGVALSNAMRVAETATSGVRILMYDGGAASGTVVDPEDRPIGNAQVVARISVPASADDFGYTEQLMTVMTSGDGSFSFSNLPTDCLYLDASCTGYARAKSLRLVLKPGEQKSGIKLQLRKARTLSGKVLSPDGKPVSKAMVNVYAPQDASSGSATSDDAGHFSIPDLSDAPHQANVSHPQYGFETYSNLYPGDKEVELRFGSGDQSRARADASRKKQTPATGSMEIIGNVVDYLTAKPISDFEADCSGLEIVKDPDHPGRFTASGARAGFAYSFRIAAPGYALYETPPIFFPLDVKVLERTFKLGPGGTVVGRTISAGDGKPLAGVTVQMLGATNIARGKVTQLQHRAMTPEHTVTTGEDGKFSILSESPGTKMVRFMPPAGGANVQITKEVDVYYNNKSDMGDIAFGSGGTIKGRLLKSPGDVPVGDAQIECASHTDGQPSPAPTRTAADGTYSFTGLINGLYFLSAPQQGASAWAGVEILETKEVDLRFGEGSIIGHVTRAGAPYRVSYRLVRLGYGQSTIRMGNTDGGGNFTVDGLPVGRWQVELTSLENGSWQLEDFVELLDGTSDPVERTFEMPVASLQVSVSDKDGKPVSGARVTVRRQTELGTLVLPDSSSAMTGENGQTAFEGLAPGSYSVLAEKSGSGQVLKDGVPVAEELPNVVAVQLENSTDGGSLVSVALNMGTGLPIPQAWCYVFRPDGTVYEHGAQRDERGVLTIENMPAGKYLTQVSAYGFSVGEQAVEVKAGGAAQIEDVLYPAGSFRWALKDAVGNPAVGIPCRLAPADPGSVEKVREGASDASGMFIARGMMPGAYIATAIRPGKPPVSVTVKIYASNATDEVTQLP